MRMSALFVQKTSDFSKFTMYPHGLGRRGLTLCEHFSNFEIKFLGQLEFFPRFFELFFEF